MGPACNITKSNINMELRIERDGHETKGSVFLTVKLVYCMLISQVALQRSCSRDDCKKSNSFAGGFLETTEVRHV